VAPQIDRRSVSVVAPALDEAPTPVIDTLPPVVANTTTSAAVPQRRTRNLSVLVRSSFSVPPGVPVRASCRTRVSLTLRRGSRVLARAKVPLKVSGRTCRFEKRFTVARNKVGSARQLRCVVRYRSTKALAGRTWSLKVPVD